MQRQLLDSGAQSVIIGQFDDWVPPSIGDDLDILIFGILDFSLYDSEVTGRCDHKEKFDKGAEQSRIEMGNIPRGA